MKIFKTFLIVLCAYSITGFIFYVSALSGRNPFHIPNFVGLLFQPLWFAHDIGFIFLPPTALLSLALLAFLNARKSGSKIWYVMSIIFFLAPCIFVERFTFMFLRSISPSNYKSAPTIPNLPDHLSNPLGRY